jgi:hypothetical protein
MVYVDSLGGEVAYVCQEKKFKKEMVCGEFDLSPRETTYKYN